MGARRERLEVPGVSGVLGAEKDFWGFEGFWGCLGILGTERKVGGVWGWAPPVEFVKDTKDKRVAKNCKGLD